MRSAIPTSNRLRKRNSDESASSAPIARTRSRRTSIMTGERSDGTVMMRTMRSIALLTLVVLAAAPAAQSVPSKTIRVRNEKQLQAAVLTLANSGGTIRLRPGFYRQLVVRRRSSRPLRIVGTRGVRIERVVFDRTKNVSLGRVRISPRMQHAIVELWDSKHIDLHDLVVSAQGTDLSATVALHRSRYVTIRRSTFTHCGDRSPVTATGQGYS